MPHPPQLTTIKDLAEAIGQDAAKVQFWATKAGSLIMYVPFIKRKRDGSARLIHAPTYCLKQIQKSIAAWLQTYYRAPRSVHGYVQGRSIITNASNHKSKREVLAVDLENFFPSITARRVKGLFMASPFNFNDTVANALVKLCVLPSPEDGLPQGAPTSSIISNMIALRLDKQLLSLAKQYRCHYTRYADDLVFSFKGMLAPSDMVLCVREEPKNVHVGTALSNIIVANGFSVNESKVKLMSRSHCRQRVTGIIVNSCLNVDRRYVRKIRAMIHSLRVYGDDEALKRHYEKNQQHVREYETKGVSFKNKIRGMIAHVAAVKGKQDSVVFNLASQFNKAVKANEKILLPVPKHCVWRVLSDEGDCGTAVSIKGIGIVTCAHVVSGQEGLVLRNEELEVSYSVEIDNQVDNIDLARLKPLKSAKFSALEHEENFIVSQGTPSIIYGYQSGGRRASMSEVKSEVRGVAKLSVPCNSKKPVKIGAEFHEADDLQSLLMSASIFKGNSGGPVISESDGKVVGIIYKGYDPSLESAPTEAIPASYLKALNSN